MKDLQIGKEEVTLFLFVDNKILHTKSGEFNSMAFWALKAKRSCSPLPGLVILKL